MQRVNLTPDYRFFGGRTLPMILQDEGAECGLACIAMIASYWGHAIDVAGMRARYPLSLKGMDLKGLINVANGIGLQSRPLRVGIDRICDVRLPCVMHWDMTHFVVLKKIKKGIFVVHDPVAGERRLSKEELSRHFTGIVLELSPGEDLKQTDDRREFTLKSLMGKVVGLRSGLLQLLALGMALQACVLLAPFFMQLVVDEALMVGDRSLITVLGIAFLILAVIQSAVSALRTWTTNVLSTSLKFGWLGNSFSHLMRLPLTYFERRHVGDILSRFGSIQVIQRTLTTQFVEAVIDGFLVVTTLAVMLVYSVKLTAIAIAAVVMYVIFRFSLFGALKAANSEQIVHLAKQETYFLESIRGVQSVKLFNRGDERRIGWTNILASQFNAELKISKFTISNQTANAFILNSERVVVIWVGALAVLDKSLTIGMLFAFLSYKEHFSQRLAALVDKAMELKMLRIHADRVADVMLAKPESTSGEVEVDPSTITPSIELRNVSFRYSKGDPFVLRNVNLKIPAGQFIAITGASGCGKTTLVKVLLGLIDPTEGEVLIGGVELHKLGLRNFRNMVGAVMQGDALFSGGISDNICFFDPVPDKTRIEICARQAAIHDEIVSMPMGYNSLIGDIGTGLSGGQQQRILLARAFYKNPSILVLDEATSNLDVANEHAVNDSVRKIRLTRVVVAHRPETISMAARVIRLEDGAISCDSMKNEYEEGKLPA